MTKNFRMTTLPNGKTVYCLQAREVNLMYQEVQEYTNHGINIRETDLVFDVGANIGLFSLWVSEKYGQSIRVFAFEPIPPVFQTLEKNIQFHKLKNVEAFPIGLSKTAGHFDFTYYPGAPLISTAYPEGWKEELGAAMLYNSEQLPNKVSWLRFFPQKIRALLINQMLGFLRTEKIRCPVRTVSDIIREKGITQIDLLKVDVERSELDVLLGVDEAHWEIIRQIVVEVHDVNERINTVTDLLRQHGFNRITVESGPVLPKSNIVSLFALR